MKSLIELATIFAVLVAMALTGCASKCPCGCKPTQDFCVHCADDKCTPMDRPCCENCNCK